MRLAAALMAAWLAGVVHAQPTPSPAAGSASELPSLARQYLGRSPQAAPVGAAIVRFAGGNEVAVARILRLDEIIVYGQVEPEDFVRRKSAMVAFRERLERERPMTPAETTRIALCLIGLCAAYGADGIPRESSIVERNAARTLASTTQMAGTFRGTLQ